MRLIESLVTTEALAGLFSDGSILQAMLDFEVALARAAARSRLIPEKAAQAIGEAGRIELFDTAQIAIDGQRAATLSIPLVKALTQRVRERDQHSANYVHWGATSQDVSDTALALLLVRARAILSADHARIMKALRRVSDENAGAIMLGRTLLQPAPPITFGLKAAGWYGALRRSWRRVEAALEETCVLQLGGASGTLASLGENGIAVTRAVAEELNLRYANAPWHAHRDRLGALVCACGVYAASLAKMARDIALLMQHEVAEAFETGGNGRGGSSTMPQKQNPSACALTLAASNRVPGLVANFLFSMTQEQERGVGGGQSEWATIAEVICATGLALESMAETAEALRVDSARMRANLESTHGSVFAERAMMMLAGTIGRDRAHALLEQAVRRAAHDGLRLTEVLADMPEVAGILRPQQISTLDSPEGYLGTAEIFRRQLLGS